MDARGRLNWLERAFQSFVDGVGVGLNVFTVLIGLVVVIIGFMLVPFAFVIDCINFYWGKDKDFV